MKAKFWLSGTFLALSLVAGGVHANEPTWEEKIKAKLQELIASTSSVTQNMSDSDKAKMQAIQNTMGNKNEITSDEGKSMIDTLLDMLPADSSLRPIIIGLLQSFNLYQQNLQNADTEQ